MELVIGTRRRGLRRGRFSRHRGKGRADFPTSTAGLGRSRDHITNGTGPGETYYECQQCGFALLSKRVRQRGGTSDGNGGITVADDENGTPDPSVKSGFCHLCGTPNHRKKYV